MFQDQRPPPQPPNQTGQISIQDLVMFRCGLSEAYTKFPSKEICDAVENLDKVILHFTAGFQTSTQEPNQ